MTPKEIEYAKRECKMIKKFNNPDNLTLMQIQHKYAVEHGYKCWAELLKGELNGKTKINEKKNGSENF